LELARPNLFILTLTAAYLLPLAIPNVGLDVPYFFITVLVLSAWFLIKWDSVKQITLRSGPPEVVVGAIMIAGDYALNYLRGSNVGILDLLVIFLGTIIFSFGVRGLKLFWVPATYGIILLAGYQLENIIPNYVALQYWLAGVVTSIINVLGVHASVHGEYVTMYLPNGTPLLLDVASACTGVQGILAFGMLSTMTLLDLKPKLSRLIPLFAIGFAGAFLINIVRLIVVFLTFEYLGVDAGTTVHVYFGYLIFIVWVMTFWALAFKYLVPPIGALPTQTSLITKPR